MEKDLFRNLPSEIKLEILSRLPIGSVFKCRLVDRSWRSMIESPEFANSNKLGPCLAVSERICRALPYLYKVYGVVDGDENSENSCKEVFNFSFPRSVPPCSSVNGLLFMILLTTEFQDFYVCNPVTREYINIPHSENVDWFAYYTCGFGVSRKSGQFKVVRIHYQQTKDNDWRASGYNVYTLGTGQWRNVAPNKMSFVSRTTKIGEFHNGNLHWLAFDSMISCFDLETKVFTTLHAPHRGGNFDCSLHVVRDCLGICDCSSKDEVVIWLMKDYGDKKSWTKQFVIPKMGHRHQVSLIHVFKDGDVLLKTWLASTERTLCYSNKTKATEVTNLIKLRPIDCIAPFSFIPSFLPLKTFSSTETVNYF